MKSWKTTAIFCAFLIVAAVGGSALYVRGQVKDVLQDATVALAPAAEMTYAGVSVGIDGNVRIYDIEIRPIKIHDTVRIERIVVETPGLWFLLTGTKDLRAGKLPKQLRLSLQGVALKLGGSIADSVDRFVAQTANASATASKSNCGEVRYVDFATYRRIGYGEFVFDLATGFRVDPRGAPLHLAIEWRTRDVATANFDLEFAGVPLNLREMTADGPRLRAFAVEYRDLSLTDRLKTFCAQANGMTVEQYVDAEVDRADAAYRESWGFVPGPGLRQAYRDFLNRPGEIRIEGTPSKDMDMQALRLFKPDDIVSILNLRVHVNGKPVTDLSMGSAPPAPTELAAAPPANRTASAPPRVDAAAAKRRAPAANARPTEGESPREIPAKDLAQHIDKIVRLSLAHGIMRQGRLLQVGNGVARLEQRYGTGSVTLAIPVRDIRRAEILF